MKLSLILLALFSGALHAKVEIDSFKKHSWNNEWNEAISLELDQKENSNMLSENLDHADLMELGCPGFNKTDDLEAKKDFWIVFFSGLTRAESAFNPLARSKAPKGGHGNYGLVQLSKRTGREQCGLTPEEIADPAAHLRCAVKLMSWQLKGAPAPSGKLLRRDLKGQLFGKRILLWGPLRQNDKRGRALLTGWFKRHLEQMPFCKSVD
nr:lytic transglycosylase domain-containing protein [Bacteriovorax sp. HI3]